MSKVTYTLGNNAAWTTEIASEADQPTPIMMSSHVYWNLDGYKGKEEATILDHTLMIRAAKYLATDGILVRLVFIFKLGCADADVEAGANWGGCFNL